MGEAHLYLVRVDDEPVRARALAGWGLLDDAERARHDRYRFERHRHEFLVTHVLKRTVLAAYGGVEAGALQLRDGPWGKPALVAPAEAVRWSFNLSNTAGLVACLVSPEREVGVDVEHVDRGGQLLDVADRYFSPLETTALHALPADAQLERFFVYWTLKEAYIKARGMGLALPLDGFSFAVEGAEPRISFHPPLVDDADTWQFHTRRVGPSHRVAVALRVAKGERLLVREMSWP